MEEKQYSDTIVQMVPFSTPRQYLAVEFSSEDIVEANLDELFNLVFEKAPAIREYYESSFKDNFVGLFKALTDLGYDFKPYALQVSKLHAEIDRIPVAAYGSCRRYYTQRASLEDLLVINAHIGIPMHYLISTSGLSETEVDEQFKAVLEKHKMNKSDFGMGESEFPPGDSPLF